MGSVCLMMTGNCYRLFHAWGEQSLNPNHRKREVFITLKYNYLQEQKSSKKLYIRY